MHAEAFAFLQRARQQYPWLFMRSRVLEAGSYDINGSPRPVFTDCQYTGLDWRAGPGVDVVGLAHEYAPEQPFDTVVSTEMLEHDPHWQRSLENLVAHLAPGGGLFLTWAAPERAAHEMACAPNGAYAGLTTAQVAEVVQPLANWHRLETATVRHGLDCQLLAVKPFTSVVIGTCGQVALLACCIQELRRTAKLPLEIIVVDNGSTAAEQAQIAKLDIDVLLTYPQPIGYAAANNAGIARAAGRYVLLCNNDAWPTAAGWDVRLSNILNNVPQAMLVAPTNPRCWHPDQRAYGAQGEDAQLVNVNRVSFVAVCLRRETLDAIGPLDERFGLGNFEDDDYCRRIEQAGGLILIDPATWFFHVGSVTLSQYDYPALMARNQQVFDQKWNGTDETAQ